MDPTKGSNATLMETWGDSFCVGAIGFVLSRLPDQGRVLWICDGITEGEVGTPYVPGLSRPPILVRCGRVTDGLAAMEAGLGCRALGAVVGTFWGRAPQIDFTATKRLALRAQANGLPCWLMRSGAAPGPSIARERWRITSLPSRADASDARAPGRPRWRADLFRSRAGRPGSWIVQWESADDGSSDRLGFHPVPVDGSPPSAVPRHAVG
ncbi:MAG: ImuA family protein [Paracoccaceae bacterium]